MLSIEELSLSPIVQEYRVWMLHDAHGSWASLMETPQPARAWTSAELWDTLPTYEEALRSMWELQRELQNMGLDRRKGDRRGHARSGGDRRAHVESQVWTPIA